MRITTRAVIIGLVAGLIVVAGQLPRWPHLPTRGAMLHPFGVPVDYQSCGYHTGQDWFAPVGTPVYAVTAGTVVYVGPLWYDGADRGRGASSIVLDHGDHYTTYGHNRRALVEVGQEVRRGQPIAEIGAEGYAGSPHLHLEKVVAPFTGDWRQPFVGCDGYRDPGWRWSPF